MKNILNERVRVLIFGREYEMDAGDLTALEVQSLANFVDERMREIADNFSIVDTQKVAVLAAINIALDYLQLKEKGNLKGNDIGSRVIALNQTLTSALNS